MDYIFRIYSRNRYDGTKYDEAVLKLLMEFARQQYTLDNHTYVPNTLEEAKEKYARFFQDNYDLWLLLHKETDELCGMVACARPAEILSVYYINGLYIKEELRGTGIASSMMTDIINHYIIDKDIKELGAFIYKSNIQSQKFFEKMGFTYLKTIETQPGLKEEYYDYRNVKYYAEASTGSSASFSDYIELRKDEHYYVKKEFDFHLPKRCVTDIKIEPVMLMFGKIYADGVAFDVVQANSTKTQPYSYEEKPDRYILHFKVGDMFCANNMVMTINNVEIIYKVLSFGQVLEDMEYLSVYDALMNCIQNNAELDVPIYFYEYTIAALMRDAKDTSKMVRQTDPLGSFKSLSISQINMRADTFVAVTTTDPETMIISALNERKDAAESPAKKTFLM